ncbi:hypothetical protein [Cohnella yongneupensis]|uniref:Glycosyltransferase family 1 protein n=1 Tax=Cohnella yongneupensis TaxID=425006 RepID=A0ABW0R120_9BACL
MYAKPFVLADFHHSSLLQSLIMLFEGRIGGSLFRPIGTEWYTHGLWRMSTHPNVVDQFLGVDEATPIITSETLPDLTYPSIYSYQDAGFSHKGITLEAFYRMPMDIVIASIPEHIEPFRHLCNTHPNKPKLIFQIGNSWTVKDKHVRNVMASAIVDEVPSNVHFIRYHQEFDLSVFSPDFSYPDRNINSLINCFATAGHFSSDWKLFEQVEQLMPDWAFRSFGGECRDGNAEGPTGVAERISEARFIWHTKNGGDGYGHVIYNSAAIARPLIVKMEYYKDQMGKELMTDGKTCVAIDGLSPEEIVQKIVFYSDEKRYAALCKNIHSNFKAKVDFNSEAKALQKFIKQLK